LAKLAKLAVQTVWLSFTSPLFGERWRHIRRLWRFRRRSKILPLCDPPPHQEIRRIAVARLDRLGDLVCCLPAFELLRAHYPQAHITGYVSAGLEFVLEQTNSCDEVVPVRWSDRKALKQARAELRSREFDLVIDLLDIERSWELEFLWGCRTKHKLGFDSRLRRWEFDLRMPQPAHHLHLTDQAVHLLRPLGIRPPGKLLVPRVEVPPAVDCRGGELLQKGQHENGPLVGIHCGGRYPFKRWQESRYAQVADHLIVEYDARVVLLCGVGEQAMAERVKESMAHPATTPQTVSLGDLCGVVRNLDMLICVDGGPMHLAGALGTPILVLWGGGQYEMFHPRWDRAEVVYHRAPCNGCPQEGRPKLCAVGCLPSETPCMSTITVEEVLQKAKRLLARSGWSPKHDPSASPPMDSE